jgi:hypothetical protein
MDERRPNRLIDLLWDAPWVLVVLFCFMPRLNEEGRDWFRITGGLACALTLTRWFIGKFRKGVGDPR